MLGNPWVHKSAPQFVNPCQRALFVSTHKPAIAGDVASEDRCQSALWPIPRHIALHDQGGVTLSRDGLYDIQSEMVSQEVSGRSCNPSPRENSVRCPSWVNPDTWGPTPGPAHVRYASV